MSRCLIIGDCHFGERGDSEKFNNQILDFLKWSVNLATEKQAEVVVQLGDWFHHRNKVNVQTLNYGIQGAKILGDHFGRERSFVLAGNHDLHYLDRLDVSSLAAIESHMTVIDKPQTILPDCFATPWIASGEMWDEVINASAGNRFLFAHLELNGFMVNDRYEMEHGRSHKELKDFEAVITGHYHSMQHKDNVLYVGTPYPITMNEANEEHGVFLLDTETGDLEFVVYDKVKVVSIPFDQIESIADYDPENTSVRIEFPDDFEDDEKVEETRKILQECNFDVVKIKYRGEKAKKLIEADVGDVVEVENIDAAVLSFIKAGTDVAGIDMDLLHDLYSSVIKEEKV